MDYNTFFQKLDGLLSDKRMDEAESYLIENMKQALEAEDTQALLTVLSELVGLYRVTGRHEKSEMFADRAMLIAEGAGLRGTQDYATIVLNAATAYRAAGDYERAGELYEETAKELEASGCQDAYRYASLYNNISLFYSETGDEKRAQEELCRALELIKGLPNCEVEEATTYVNLALLYIKGEKYEAAEENIAKALEIFKRDKGRKYKDAHYGAALSAYGDLHLKKCEYAEAVDNYEEALIEIARSYGYNNSAYRATCENCIEAYVGLLSKEDSDEKRREYEERAAVLKEKLDTVCKDGAVPGGLELARAYYETYVKDMLHRDFADYEDRIAVGLAGHGSECFGFDDRLSTDHDFGPAVCLWLTDEDYEKIGVRLSEEYDRLPKSFLGVPARTTTKNGHGRVGVIRMSDFFAEHIGCREIPAADDIAAWSTIPEEGAAAALNGEIFKDDSGRFTAMRQELRSYYPDALWFPKMAEAAVHMAQYGQYNYARCVKREDYTAAALAYSGFIEETIRLCFLVYREYMPYYKWSYRALTEMAERRQEPLLSQICAGIKKLSMLDFHDSEAVQECVEQICGDMVKLLKTQSLSGSSDIYMESQGYSIMQTYENIRSVKEKNTARKDGGDGGNASNSELIDEIVDAEWRMFQKTENEGGRADCQNNYNTFSLMRRSQFMAWSEELLRSYLLDLKEGERTGRNLITEKYARMMKSTAPEEYEKLKGSLPEIDDDRRRISEQVIAIQVGWLEDFCRRYPVLAGQIRYIHTSEDTAYDTSAETYLRGELDTYSENTFILYCRYVAKLCREGKSLNEMIMENTVLQYGYQSLEDAERKMGDFIPAHM